ncbi:MAG TPA: glycosyltransferase [Spirochaetota bacterium]|nr:glycosyltransferase [Spirochaetota bacterium]HPI89564.1 glycosyltransferase [Spirochaetota bacterium]HPR49028.1 glycosyltransferase [Spirochaetota bacterium]
MKIITIFPKDSEALFNRYSQRTFGGADIQMYLITRELKSLEGIEVFSFIINYPRIDFNDGSDFNLIKTYSESDNLFKKFFIYHSIIKDIRPDVIIQRGLTLFSCLLALYCRVKRIKFVFMFAHDIESRGRYQKNQKKCLLFPVLLSSAYKLIVQNGYEYKQLITKTQQKKIKIIKKGLDLKKIPQKKVKLYDAVWVARCEPWKNPEIFIELARRNKEYAFLMICSRVADKEDYFIKIKSEAQKNSNIIFIDFINNNQIYDLLSQSRIFCITSQLEGDWPMAVLEAAATGLPILSLNLNYGDLFDKYNAGYHSKDIEHLCEDFLTLVNDKKLYDIQSENAKRYINENHLLSVNIKTLVNIISGAHP